SLLCSFFFHVSHVSLHLHSFPTRRSSDLSILLPFPSPFKNHHDTIRQNISICLNNEKISFILSICELIWKYVKVWSHCSFPINKRLCSTLYKAAFIRASKVTYHIKIH